MKNQTTLKDIARECGLSLTTVSAIIRKQHAEYHIAKSTVENVLKTAKKMGYRKNRMARTLKTGVSDYVAVLGAAFGAPIQELRQNLIAQRVLDLGYQVLVYDFHWFRGRELELIKDMVAFPVCGMIVSDTLSNEISEYFKDLQDRIPVVLVDCGDIEGHDHVVLDRRKVAYLAARRLLELGHRKIIYNNYLGNDYWILRWKREGFTRAMHEFGLQVDKSSYVWLPDSNKLSAYQLGYNIAEKLIADGALPEAVIAQGDRTAIGLVKAFSKHGLRIPDDIALMSSENLPQSAYHSPELSTVDFRTDEVAEATVAILRKRLSGDFEDIGKTVKIDPLLVIRESCGASRSVVHKPGKKKKGGCYERSG